MCGRMDFPQLLNGHPGVNLGGVQIEKTKKFTLRKKIVMNNTSQPCDKVLDSSCIWL